MKKHKKYIGMMPSRKAVIKGMIEIQDKAEVDGDTWYVVQVNPRVCPWIREQNKDLWHEHIDQRWYTVANTFDVHEKIYTMLALTWS